VTVSDTHTLRPSAAIAIAAIKFSLTADTDHFSARMRRRRTVLAGAWTELRVKPQRVVSYFPGRWRDAGRVKICAQCGGLPDFRSKYRITLSDFPLADEIVFVPNASGHGFVCLSPCFSRALAPVSAESRHEAKQSFISRITPLRK
jgi:hypothetical protein